MYNNGLLLFHLNFKGKQQKKNWLITCSSKVCHCAKIPLTNTGCPKSSFLEFHALYLLIKTIFLGEIFRRCLFLYQVHVFRISVTSMPFLFFFLSLFVAFAAWIGIQRVDPQMIHFELFYHLVRRIQFNPQTKFV